jgi:hypothetical protein
MNSAYALPRRGTGFTVVIFGLVLIPAAVLDEAAGGEKRKADAKRAAEMVDAIVNRNKAPKLVKWQGDFPSWAALFPEDYDWKEEARVRKAISQLERDQTEEVWEELVKRIGDRRYSETVTSVKTGDAYIKAVGSVCGWLAYSRLIGVFWQHLPLSPFKDGEILRLDVGIRIGDLAKWRKQRAAMSLYELQIEVCEKAIEALAKVERVPQAQKDQARKKIEAEIAKLKKTKRPVHVQGDYNFEERGVYNADLAKRVRQGVKSGKYGDLGIIK